MIRLKEEMRRERGKDRETERHTDLSCRPPPLPTTAMVGPGFGSSVWVFSVGGRLRGTLEAASIRSKTKALAQVP